MGFQDVPRIVHTAASRKGGRIKIDKGFAKNKELAKLAGAKGGHAKEANKTKRQEKPVAESGEASFLDEILGVLDEQVQK